MRFAMLITAFLVVAVAGGPQSAQQQRVGPADLTVLVTR